MKELQLREAKTTLSAVVEAAENGEPTTITKHGRPAAVVIFSRGVDEAQNQGSVLCRSFVGRPAARSRRPAKAAPGQDRAQGRLQVMPGYLLDTNALSILAPPAIPRNATMSDGAAFRAWVREHDDELFLSAITLAEIQASVSRLERKGAARRCRRLVALAQRDSRTLSVQNAATRCERCARNRSHARPCDSRGSRPRFRRRGDRSDRCRAWLKRLSRPMRGISNTLASPSFLRPYAERRYAFSWALREWAHQDEALASGRPFKLF